MESLHQDPQNTEENDNSSLDQNANDSQIEKKSSAAPFLSDLTDGREPGDWKSRYDDPYAIKCIKYEKNYLLILVIANILISFILGLLLETEACKSYCPTSRKYIFAFLGGLLGGCAFSIKWLIHSVAKNTWNRDRRLWRIFTPLVSGMLGFVVILLLSTKTITLGSLDSADTHKCYGIAFLIGYFSDNAIGKLTEIAQVFFGSSINKKS